LIFSGFLLLRIEKCPKNRDILSGVALGASRRTRPGAQALGTHQNTLFSHLKTRFKAGI